VNFQGFLHPATAFAATAKDYPWISLRTSSWKPIWFEGNFRRSCPEISLKKANVAKGFTEAGLDFAACESTTYSCRSVATEFGPECVKTPATLLPPTSDGAECQAIKIDLGVAPKIALVETNLGNS
jgi:hypothetical protein